MAHYQAQPYSTNPFYARLPESEGMAEVVNQCSMCGRQVVTRIRGGKPAEDAQGSKIAVCGVCDSRSSWRRV